MTEVDKSEKITVNVGLVDLRQADLPVIKASTPTARTSSVRRSGVSSKRGRAPSTTRFLIAPYTRGTQYYSQRELEESQAAGQLMELQMLGLATLADDVSPEFGSPPSRQCRSSARFGRRGRLRLHWHLARMSSTGVDARGRRDQGFPGQP